MSAAPLQTGFVFLQGRPQKPCSSLPPCKVTVRKELSLTQEVGPENIGNLLSSWNFNFCITLSMWLAVLPDWVWDLMNVLYLRPKYNSTFQKDQRIGWKTENLFGLSSLWKTHISDPWQRICGRVRKVSPTLMSRWETVHQGRRRRFRLQEWVERQRAWLRLTSLLLTDRFALDMLIEFSLVGEKVNK